MGSSLPPAELARRDSALFGEVKCLFSIAPEVGKETEANGGHRGDRTLNRTRSLFDRTCPVNVERLRVLIGRVRSVRELTELQPDAGTVASGQFNSASGQFS